MTIAFLALCGLIFGSFIDAVTWRLHTKRNFITGRSECETCHHQLAPADLIPVVSWLLLKGRCRYCGVRLSPVQPITELAMGAAFAASLIFWPFGFDAWQAQIMFGLWLAFLVGLGVLFVYDLRWMLLPDVISGPLIAAAFGFALLRYSLGAENPALIAADATLLAFIYWVLHTVSKGRWVGYGDVKLSIFIGLVLGWQKSLLALGLANVLGLLVLGPVLLAGRLTPQSRIPFGPFLILACIIAFLWGDWLIRTYLALAGL